MRLEQVLAQWAKGASLSGGTQEPARTSVAGRWTNEYGSVAEIIVDGDRVSGTYTSAVGGPTGSMSGPITLAKPVRDKIVKLPASTAGAPRATASKDRGRCCVTGGRPRLEPGTDTVQVPG